MKGSYDAVVVGGGLGGLSCGAWMAKHGMSVLVIEQNKQLGGLCSTYHRNGYYFTIAASEATGTAENGVILRTMRALDIEKEVEFIPLEQGYHVHFPDFDYRIYSGSPDARDHFMEQFLRLFPAEAAGIRRFFETLSRINDQADYAAFLGTGPLDIARILLKCPTLLRYMTKDIVSFMDGFVRDPRLRAALSINATCANLPPSRMSALGIAGLLIEGSRSIPHIKGGAQAIPEAFAHAIQRTGGDICTGTLVDKILVENGRAVGVRMRSALSEDRAKEEESVQEVRARYVVSNASARQTFFELLDTEEVKPAYRAKLRKLEPTPPFCALLLGIDLDLAREGLVPALHIHSGTYDTEQYFSNPAARLLDESGPDPFFRFQLANLSDPDSAPPGKTALVIHAIPAPTQGWDDPGAEQRAADKLIRCAEKKLPGFSRHIEYREFWSPPTMNRLFKSGSDASIGWALTPQQVGPRRLAQDTPVENLFLSGHWTRPAIGIMGVVVSGLQAAQRILQREGVSEPLEAIGVRKGVYTG